MLAGGQKKLASQAWISCCGAPLLNSRTATETQIAKQDKLPEFDDIMNAAQFLFPSDLEVTPSNIKKILVIGSCLSEAYVRRFRLNKPSIVFDHILFNNASDLPKKTEEDIGSYDFHYVQIPLRSVLTDAVIRIADGEKNGNPIDWVELGKTNIERMLEKALSYNVRTNQLTFVSNFVVPQGDTAPSLLERGTGQDLSAVVRELNSWINYRVRDYKNVYVADIDMIASSLGKKYFLDDAISFYSHGSVFYTDWAGHERTPYWTQPGPGRIEEIQPLGLTYENKNDEYFEAIFRQMEAMYRTVKQIDMVKVVIFDLDNTMWRGQLVEHYQPGLKWPYSDGWPLGIWEAVHHLRRRGIVTSIASKNDEELVIKKWDDAVQPPFVKYDDFLAPKIGWQAKAENIRTLLKELSLTERSALLVDDNPVERESVKAMLPGIRVIGSDPFVVKRILLWSPETQLASRSQESVRREQMLKQQIERETEKSKLSREDFLKNLGSTVTLWAISDSNHGSFSRVFELVNKTNQFNTTGHRWSHEECRKFFEQGGVIYAFSVKDRYAEYGTVGAAFVSGSEIKQYVMSCRVLGMDIETAVVSKIAEIIRFNQLSGVVSGVLFETEANTPCREVFNKAGFSRKENNLFVLGDGVMPPVMSYVEIKLT